MNYTHLIVLLGVMTLIFQVAAAKAEVSREERVSVIKHTCDLVVETRPGGMVDSVIGEGIVILRYSRGIE